MKRASIVGGGCVAVLLLVLAVAAGSWFLNRDADFGGAGSPAVSPPTAPPGVEAHPAAEGEQGFLYGRIVTVDGATFEGRLRFAGSQEAFWGDYFHGKERENRWLARVPPDVFPEEERGGISILGNENGGGGRRPHVGRLFMARFGHIEPVEASGRELRVTLKSGTVLDLDRLEASDFDDGVRVWDAARGVTDLKSLRIRTIELLPTPPPTSGSPGAPYRLQGTVRTRQGDFTGFVAWSRDDAVGSDTLDGRTAQGQQSLRFDTVRAIERRSRDSALATLLDGREVVLSGTGAGDVGPRNRGIYVDDPRFGRVQVSWDAFERADFRPGGSGPAYGEFPPGRPLAGSVTTRAGRRLEGRLVYDLDESETTDTLDADDRGLHYTIPFGLVATITPGGPEGGRPDRPTVTLHNGEELHLEPTGDLRPDNAGLLVFAEGRGRPEYVPWSEVRRIELDRPPATYPPLAE
ncbi:MAG TPA: hypothetical protein VLF66_18875 [Thermoanaerobaculia bacterium]|nr:hypothetical protein [Thermoanaerobaculia bacterium]